MLESIARDIVASCAKPVLDDSYIPFLVLYCLSFFRTFFSYSFDIEIQLRMFLQRKAGIILKSLTGSDVEIYQSNSIQDVGSKIANK